MDSRLSVSEKKKRLCSEPSRTTVGFGPIRRPNSWPFLRSPPCRAVPESRLNLGGGPVACGVSDELGGPCRLLVVPLRGGGAPRRYALIRTATDWLLRLTKEQP